MSSGASVALAIAMVVVFGAIYIVTTARRDRAAALRGVGRETRRKDRSAVAVEAVEGRAVVTGRDVERSVALERRGRDLVLTPAAPPAPRGPVDEETIGVTRRQFFNRSIVGMFTLGLAGFGGSVLGFLWPTLSGGFGAKIRAGSLSEIQGQIAAEKKPFYVPEGRFYLVPFPRDALPKASTAYAGGVLEGMEAGLVALYQKCVHLGCRVPWCQSAQWFECPCHGSRYNRVGEKRGGPAPRGLDRFPVAVQGGTVVVDTGQLVIGPPIGTNTTGQEAEGPHCA